MGRLLKRVPLNFDAPLNKTWSGYVNPFYEQLIPCQYCVSFTGDGRSTCMSIPGRILQSIWYRHAFEEADMLLVIYGRVKGVIPPDLDTFARRVIRSGRDWAVQLDQDDVDALMKADRLWDFTRRPRNEEQVQQLIRQREEGGSGYWLKEGNGFHPTAAQVNDVASRSVLFHDGINSMIVMNARAKRMGFGVYCLMCRGNGHAPNMELEAQIEAWTETEPPEGEGFQLWENTTEGSPQSPVFLTIEDLCNWAAEHAFTFGGAHATADQWRAMLDEGFVRHEQRAADGTILIFT